MCIRVELKLVKLDIIKVSECGRSYIYINTNTHLQFLSTKNNNLLLTIISVVVLCILHPNFPRGNDFKIVSTMGCCSDRNDTV